MKSALRLVKRWKGNTQSSKAATRSAVLDWTLVDAALQIHSASSVEGDEARVRRKT